MLPTVADVVALPAMRHGSPRVVAGRRCLTKQVRWVHSAEVSDVARLIRGGDLVLTTGIALPSADAGLAGYVADLAEAGAAGLVVELGRRWQDELPAAMIDASDAAGLPLVTLRREVRFVTVAESVGELVVDAQLAELRAAERMHQTFTTLSIDGAEPAEILAEVCRLSGLPVVLESIRRQVLDYNAAGGDPDELISDWEERSRRVSPPGRTGYDDSSGWLVTVVGARGDDWGRLVLLSPDPPPQRNVVLTERAASALALQRLAARDRESLERHTHRTLLTAIAAGPLVKDIAIRCAALGVPITNRRLTGVIVVPHMEPKSARTPAGQETIRDLADITAAATRHLGIAALVGIDDDAVRVLVSHAPRTNDTVIIDRLAEQIHRAAATAPRPMTVLVAAGTTVNDLGTRRTLLEARHVADAANQSRTHRTCHRLDDVRLRGLLHHLADDERLAAFAARELEPLLAYDRTHRTRLMQILRARVNHGANKSAAAKSVHLSRAAFYDRLNRIEHILGVELSNAESLTSLHLAILTHDISQQGEIPPRPEVMNTNRRPRSARDPGGPRPPRPKGDATR